MRGRAMITSIVLTAALCLASGGARAFDETKYPDWRGQWSKLPVPGIPGNPSWDPHKQEGRFQEPPLTPEYQAIFDASLADQAAGGAGLDRDFTCLTPGMPRMMTVYSTMEILVMPDTTYMLMSTFNDVRRIYTDGRGWPVPLETSFAGTSLGAWIDSDGDGRYDLLEVETRGFHGLRTLDSTAIPLHENNQTVVKERIFSDKANPNILHDEITIIDDAFTHPWVVTKDYRRAPQARPQWRESGCIENNQHVMIGNEHYMLSWDGKLMPSKRGQKPPDLNYFK
jgi:hypothetical protein